MGARLKDQENCQMKCRTCGSMLESVTTDLPFKLRDKTIVILRELPVLQCGNCTEYLIDDQVFSRVEEILSSVGDGDELKIINFAA